MITFVKEEVMEQKKFKPYMLLGLCLMFIFTAVALAIMLDRFVTVSSSMHLIGVIISAIALIFVGFSCFQVYTTPTNFFKRMPLLIITLIIVFGVASFVIAIDISLNDTFEYAPTMLWGILTMVSTIPVFIDLALSKKPSKTE